MRSIVTIVLALSLLSGSPSVQAQSANTPTSAAPKAGVKITKKSQLHDGCHSRYAQMLGKPCH
ncbi:hypothetical protein LPJ38_30945 [Bradyrhizobium daqingense]|uniref:Uncharacterized protein n=1 Tax=Bradyrhizobium daqingense TaxID=993502 RepID=A0A562LPZ1_9BRAD|nr:hypothetical protein [Bradyrhizobium daqingense]TWI09685.1 hypothetical protein IQ17_00764 [Bradyrhizobium daqingense]UFS88009.1 hypothetical protein LPJ38_30945 [Bradyrhizobium daqingense]